MKWVSVKERLPEKDGCFCVLLCYTDVPACGKLKGFGYHTLKLKAFHKKWKLPFNIQTKEVQYWCELPTYPKEVENDDTIQESWY